MKKYASHHVITIDNQYLKQYIVKISNAKVVEMPPLTEEGVSVEWFPGAIQLDWRDYQIIAYHLFPFDFT